MKGYAVKSRSVFAGGEELTLEVRLGGGNTRFVSQLQQIEGVEKAVLVSYNGDYMS